MAEELTAAEMEYCKRKEEYYKKLLDLKSKYESAKSALKKLLGILFGGKGALKAIANSLVAEVVAAASAFATQIVGAYFSAASAAVRTAIEIIFNQILKILLAGPEAIFSLVNLPLKQAKYHAKREAFYLNKAKTSLNIIMTIMNKWLGGMESDRFYRQMKESILFIAKALDNLQSMIKDLGMSSPVFDNEKFSRVMKNLDLAIEKTVPKSVLMEKLGVSDQLDQDRTQWERDKINEAKKSYLAQRKVKLQDWRDAVNALRSAPTDKVVGSIPNNAIKSNLATSVLESKLAIVDAKYESQLEIIDREFEIKKADIKSQAAIEFSSPSRIAASIHTTATRIEEEFKSDLQLMKINLNIMMSSVKDAFVEYKECQFFTGVTYTSIDRLKSLIKWFIQLGNKVGQSAAQGLLFSFNASEVLVQDVKNSFEQDTKQWETEGVNNALMATNLTVGNIELKAASSVLMATATQSLTATINFDEFLREENDKFLIFKNDVWRIPDFKGIQGKWGTNDLSSLGDVTVYVALIAKISNQILSAPVRIASPGQQEKLELQKSMVATSQEFDRILNHNSIVLRVLTSYTPFQSEMTNQLKRLLDSLTPWLAYAMIALSVQELANALNSKITDFFNSSIDCSKYKAAQQSKQDLSDLIAKMNAEKALAASTTNNNTSYARSYQTGQYRDSQAEKSLIDPTKGLKSGPDKSSVGMGDFAPRPYIDSNREDAYGGASGSA